MHTYESKSGVIFHFNSDLSGEVIVTNTMREETRVPFAALAEFVDSHRRLRGGKRNAPRDAAKAAERAASLERAKDSVVNAIRRVAEPDVEVGMGGSWPSELERQLFEVAVNSVRGAR